MLALLALGLGLRAGPATVSLTEFATPLTRLMPKLAELTHQSLKASKAVEGEVLCIDVHDVDTDELLKRIAQATGCDWLKKDNALYLTPNEKARNALTQKGFSVRVGQIEKEIEAFNPAGKATPPQNKSQWPWYQADVPPTFYKLLKGVGAETIAAIASGERLVLSSRPTARQGALPPLGPNDISDYVEMENKARKQPPPDGYQPPEPVSQIAGSVAKVDLALARHDIFELSAGQGTLGAALVLYDAAGKELDRYYLPFDDGSDAWYMNWGVSETAATGTAEKPIKLSPEAIRFARAGLCRPGWGEVGSPLQSRKIVEEELRHPELHDPLAYPSEFLTGTSEARHLQLVASLPDSFAWWQDIMLTPITASKAIELLRKDSRVRLETEDGWMIVSPTDFTTPRMDRKELGDLRKRFRGNVSWSLDDLIDLDRAGVRNPAREILLVNWLKSGNASFYNFVALQDWKFVHFVSTLDPALRATLNKSQSLRVGDLGLESRQALDDAIYNVTGFGGEYAGPLRVDAKVPYPGPPSVEYGDGGSESTADYRAEPTEVAPNGLPSDAMVTITTLQQKMLFPAVAGSADWDVSYFSPSTVDGLARTFAMSEPQYLTSVTNPRSVTLRTQAFSECYLGTEMALNFRVYAGPESFKTGKILTRTASPDDTYTPKTLPADMQADFDRLLKEAVARNKAYQSGDRPPAKSGPP